MPKDAIRIALRGVAAQVKREKGFEGVWVPSAKRKPCAYATQGRHMRGAKCISFDRSIEVMEFPA